MKTKPFPKSYLPLLGLLALLLSMMGGTCSDPIYSNECRDLADNLNKRIAAIAGDYGDCASDSDCSYAAVVVPCNRDNVVNVVFNPAHYDAFREEIIALADSKCSASNIDDCNAQCGTGGSLIFPITGSACEENHCVAVAASDSSDASLESAELCHPSKYVYLPDDLGEGLNNSNSAQ